MPLLQGPRTIAGRRAPGVSAPEPSPANELRESLQLRWWIFVSKLEWTASVSASSRVFRRIVLATSKQTSTPCGDAPATGRAEATRPAAPQVAGSSSSKPGVLLDRLLGRDADEALGYLERVIVTPAVYPRLFEFHHFDIQICYMLQYVALNAHMLPQCYYMFLHFAMKVDHWKSRHFRDDPVCPDRLRSPTCASLAAAFWVSLASFSGCSPGQGRGDGRQRLRNTRASPEARRGSRARASRAASERAGPQRSVLVGSGAARAPILQALSYLVFFV